MINNKLHRKNTTRETNITLQINKQHQRNKHHITDRQNNTRETNITLQIDKQHQRNKHHITDRQTTPEKQTSHYRQTKHYQGNTIINQQKIEQHEYSLQKTVIPGVSKELAPHASWITSVMTIQISFLLCFSLSIFLFAKYNKQGSYTSFSNL